MDVGIGGVLKETAALIGRRKVHAGALLLLLLLTTLPLELATRAEDASAVIPGGWWTVLLVILASTVIQAAFFQFFIRALRNEEPRALPKGLLAKSGRVLLREVLVLAAVFIPGAVVVAVCMVAASAFYGGQPTDPGFVRIIQVAFLAGLALGFGWPVLRLGAGIAGVTVDEDMSLKESWRMTRGYSLRLFLFFLPMLIIPEVVSGMTAPLQDADGLFSSGTLVAAVASALLYVFYYAGFSVWYVRLRERYSLAPGEKAVPKIPLLAVATDALRLMRLRAWAYLGGGLLIVALGLSQLYFVSAAAPSETFSPAVLAFWLFAMLVGPVVYVYVIGDSLSVLRGPAQPLSAGFIRRYLRLLGKGFLLCLMIIGLAIPISLVLGGMVFVLQNVSSVDHDVYKVLSVAALSLPMVYFFVRWGLAPLAAAAGDSASFRLSWRMTRGYSLRMYLFVLPGLVLSGGAGAVQSSALRSGTFELFSPLSLSTLVLSNIVCWFYFAAWIIWYERLRMAHEEAAALESTN
jgi:hypothetical protein